MGANSKSESYFDSLFAAADERLSDSPLNNSSLFSEEMKDRAKFPVSFFIRILVR